MKKIDVKKLSVIVLLVLIVLGFTLPGIFYMMGPESTDKHAEPRICNGDGDCYLLCGDKPVSVLCYRSTCQRNSCDEYSPVGEYGLVENHVTIGMIIGNQTINVTELSPLIADELFVTMEGEDFVTHADYLTLNHILDKFQLALTPYCLIIGQHGGYCIDKGNLTLSINGQANAPYGEYVVQDNDELQIVYELYDPEI